MDIRHVEVGDAAVQVLAGSGASGDRLFANVRNAGADVCDVGDATVEPGLGYAVGPGESVPVTLSGGDQLWAVCAAGVETTLHVLEAWAA